MPSVQTTYTENQVVGVHGQIADGTPCIVDSYVLEGSNDVEFGTVVYQGTNDNGCSQVEANAANYLGVAVKDPTRYPGDMDEYKPGSVVNVLSKGDIFLRVATAVTAGSNANFINATGVLSTEAAGTTMTRARWMTAAAANGIAKLRVDIITSA